MQQTGGIAKRYARALYRLSESDVAKARAMLDKFDVVRELFAVDMASRVLRSPVMPKDLKGNLLQYALKQGPVDEGLRRFIDSIVEAGRVGELPSIIDSFQAIIEEHEGFINAEVTSAVKLSDAELQKITSALTHGKKVKLTNHVDPNILGGMILRVGNKVVDQSFKSKINTIAASAVV